MRTAPLWCGTRWAATADGRNNRDLTRWRNERRESARVPDVLGVDEQVDVFPDVTLFGYKPVAEGRPDGPKRFQSFAQRDRSPGDFHAALAAGKRAQRARNVKRNGHATTFRVSFPRRSTSSSGTLRIELQASIDMGAVLSRREHLPELALKYLNAAAERFDDDTPFDAKKTVGIERGKRLIAAGHETEGVAALSKVREEFPFDADVTYALARQAQKDNRLDEALALFGELQILPQLEQSLIESHKSLGHRLPVDQYPRRIVSRLWTQKHGDAKGLTAWLNELYESRIRSIATDKIAPRGEGDGTRVVICELFTGAASVPAVAAEAALSALGAAAAKSELIVVRYHVNVPSPDPLANDENQDRYKMYNGTATPMLLINGRPLPGIAGGLSEAPAVYHRLRRGIEEMLKDNTRTPPDEQAAFRIDFPQWLASLDERRRRIVEELMLDEATLAVAARHGVSPARISQMRREFRRDWLRYVGEVPPSSTFPSKEAV